MPRAMDFKDTYKSLTSQAGLLRTVEDYRAWLLRCDDSLTLVKHYINVWNNDLSNCAKRRLIARICRLKDLRVLTGRLFLKMDGGFADMPDASSSIDWEDVETAFLNHVMTGVIVNHKHIDPLNFLEDARCIVIDHIENAITRHSCLKVNTSLDADFISNNGTSVKSFSTRIDELYLSTNLWEWYSQRVMKPLIVSMEESQDRDGGWALHRILHLTVNCDKYKPMSAGCRKVSIPPVLRWKKALVNVDYHATGEEDTCFLWSVVAGLYKTDKNVSVYSSYPHYADVLCTEGVQLPMMVFKIPQFEKNNDISINVYVWQDDECLPCYLTSNKQARHVNLLMLDEEGVEFPPRHHYVCIKNLSRLVSRQLSKHAHATYICDRCLHYFSSQRRLDSHTVNCRTMNDCAMILPSEEEKWLRFKNHTFKKRVPFVIYAALECLLEDGKPEEQARRFPTTMALNSSKHRRPYSIGYYVHCAYDESLSYYHAYRNETGCVEWFVKQLKQIGYSINDIHDRRTSIKSLSSVQLLSHSQATVCHICKKTFDALNIKVYDYCHFTGEYNGAAHNSCIMNYNKSLVIPVVFHNLSGYDAHFIIKELNEGWMGKIDVLPLNKEKYISFTKHLGAMNKNFFLKWKDIQFRFIDSMKFLNSSLDKLSSYLSKDKMRVLQDEYKHLSETDFNLLTRTGVFPYDYATSYNRLLETSLPSREMFYNKLRDTNISEADYRHAVDVWSRFRIRTLGEYSDLCLKLDVLLLADVFENFRNDCLINYKLDPAHHYTLAGFAWDAMLKYTRVELELLTDIDMVLFVERGIRSGLAQCSHRYARANNIYLPTYDPSEATKYLMHFNVNDLYGWAMSQYLPHSGFRWLNDRETMEFDVNSISTDAPFGYILEVDLEYSRELHDLHADIPFCPSYCGEIAEKRLLATVYDKERYVIHYRYLQQCLKHGLKLIKIRRILQFRQSDWLRGYIDLNTKFRASQTNEFSKNLFKLMNDVIFGKSMENVRNHANVKLVKQWHGRFGAEAQISKPNFQGRTIFNENLMAVELRRLQVKFQRPIYLGACISDLSKMFLYNFHYDYMLPVFDKSCKMLYADPESLIYEIECDDVYEIMKRDLARFDTSNYADDNPYGIPPVNKNVAGLMKDENNGAIMTEFAGLRARLYETRVQGVDESMRKMKGTKTNVTTKYIKFEDYIECLNSRPEKTVRKNELKYILQFINSINEPKLGLNPCDEKRFIVRKSMSTLPWGHYSIIECE